MPVSLSFRRDHDYSGDASGAVSIPVTLRHGNNAVELIPRVDTGATYCVFKYEHGDKLGLVIEEGIPLTIQTPAGGQIPTFGHEVTIECLEYSFTSLVYFAAMEGFDRDVLGRHGWLQQFRIALIHHNSALHLSQYDDPE